MNWSCFCIKKVLDLKLLLPLFSTSMPIVVVSIGGFPTFKVVFSPLFQLSSFEKYKTNIDDIRGKRRHDRNILQWSKNDFKSRKTTNGDCYSLTNVLFRPKVLSWNFVKLVFIILTALINITVSLGPKSRTKNWQILKGNMSKETCLTLKDTQQIEGTRKFYRDKINDKYF